LPAKGGEWYHRQEKGPCRADFPTSEVTMIRLIRADGTEILLNVDLIQSVECTPETVITLTDGDRITVKNTVTDVVTKVNAYQTGLMDETRIYEGGVDEVNRGLNGHQGKRPTPAESAPVKNPQDEK